VSIVLDKNPEYVSEISIGTKPSISSCDRRAQAWYTTAM